MDSGYLLLFIIFSLGILAKAHLLSWAAVIIFFLRILQFKSLILILEERGLDIGLFFLILAVLTPLVTNELALAELITTCKSPLGVMAVVGGLLATKVNGTGLDLLEVKPELILQMVLGSLVGIIFLDGIPVGPLTAGGITALFYRLFTIVVR
ncbi:MAG: DUF441 domain-containing protein [Bacillota bacterium]